MSETHDVRVARLRTQQQQEKERIEAQVEIPNYYVIMKVLELKGKCPINSWADMPNGHATLEDVHNAQITWIQEHWND